MRYELTNYQREATLAVLERLHWGSEDWHTRGERSSFALSAITGAGKTVIATAAIEALFFGSSDLGTERNPRATFLWITDDPALNRQTRNRMMAASDLLAPKHLTEIDDGFPRPCPGPRSSLLPQHAKTVEDGSVGADNEPPPAHVLGCPREYNP